jgi:hypothetical protein
LNLRSSGVYHIHPKELFVIVVAAAVIADVSVVEDGASSE